MSEWKTYKLEEVGKIITGKTPPTANTENFGSLYPFITPRDMIGIKKVGITERLLSEDGKEKLKNNLLPPNAICVSCIGSDLGKIVKTTKPSFTNQQINSIVCKSVFDPDFIYYSLWLIIDSLQQLGRTSTAVPIVNKSTFSSFEITVPCLELQRQIASILSSLDDKIELNLKMNETLEAMAQAIFKEWFVDFRFPGFDGKLVEGLPKGWRIGNLGDVLELQYGKALKAEIRSEGQYPVVGSSGIVGSHSEYLVNGPGIVIGRKGTIGEVIWVNDNFFPIDTTFYVVDKIGVKDLFYHFYLLKQQDFKKIGSDSAVPGLNRNHAHATNTIIPSMDIIVMFNNMVKPFFDKQRVFKSENNTLSQIRDRLLPKLMSGKITVN